MSRPVWQMSSDLGTVPELSFYEIPLKVTNPNNASIEFSLLSGEIPPGVQVVKSGMIQGVPVILDSLPVDESRRYVFTVRARESSGTVVDKTFIMTVTNVFPPLITPKVRLIDHVFDGTYFEHQMIALDNNPNSDLHWTLVSGQLPAGITMTENGLLQGYIRLQTDPLVQALRGYDAYDSSTRKRQYYDAIPYDSSGRSKNRSYVFTVQVTDGSNVDSFTFEIRVATKQLFSADQDHIALPSGSSEERVSITVDNDYLTVDHDQRYLPIITTPPQALPVIRQENNFAFKFDAIDFNDDDLEWTIQLASGAGFDQNNYSIPYASSAPEQWWGTGTSETITTSFLFDSNGIDTDFSFDREGYSDQASFIINGINKVGISSQGVEQVLEEYQVTTDYTVSPSGTGVIFSSAPSTGRLRMYVMVNLPESVVFPRFDSDEDGINGIPALPGSFDNGLFDQSESRLPPDLSINSDGWLYGVVAPQTEQSKTYDFIIKAFKKDDPTYISEPVQYSLTILGDEVDVITWITPADLGEINNGSISELKVSATSGLGKRIIYSLESGKTQRLPQGLRLLNDGLISGRASFRYASIDQGETTFDRDGTQFDNNYQFTVRAETEDKLAVSIRTFNVRVTPRYSRPYENLYFKAFPRLHQRQLFADIIGNPEIFPDNLIYRPTDPWFGKAQDIKFLEVAGLSPSELAEYADAVSTRHHWKRIDFGDVKTAVAVDEFYNIKYEVVYVEVYDPTDADVSGVTERINLPEFHNSYLEYKHRLGALPSNTDVRAYRTVYPNNFANLDDSISTKIGYQAQGVYPDWMLSVQPDKTILGFRRAVVLAYTIPGASKLIAYRLKNNGIKFDQIEFTIDRYQLDNGLTDNFNISEDQFDAGKETTFDRLILGPGELDGGIVDYAVRQSFESINNRTVKYLLNNGGIDGVKTFEDGDLLVFAKQEGFSSDLPYDGWIDRQNLYFGDIINDVDTDGDGTNDLEAVTRLPSTDPSGSDTQYGYDSYQAVPGFWENRQTIRLVPLVQTANAGQNGSGAAGTSYIYVPYNLGDDDSYIGKSVSAYSGIADNTIVLEQSVFDAGTPGNPALQTRLKISNEIESEITMGGTIEVSLAMISAEAGENSRVKVISLPAGLRKGGIISGQGIPVGAVVTDIIGDYIYANKNLSSVAAGTVVSYRTSNQRGGIWKINIVRKEHNIDLIGNVDLATNISYISIQNNSLERFLKTFPNGIDGLRTAEDLEGKTIALVGNHIPDRFWTNPDIFDLSLASIGSTTVGGYDYTPGLIVPEEQRRGTWKINFVDSGSEKIFVLTPEISVSINERITVIQGQQYTEKSFYITNDRIYAAYPPAISKDQDLVQLEFVQEIQLGQKVKVLAGKSHGFTFLFYDPITRDGETVPAYRKWQDQAETVDKTTTFDGNGTRFFNYRDTYSEPGRDDKYIKFPKIGVFT